MRAVLIAPNLGQAGGVERFCALLARVLESAGWQTSTVAPERERHRLVHTVGLGPWLEARESARRARLAHADLAISNGYLGGPCSTPRIHVFHGTMISHVVAARSGPLRYRLKQAVGTSIPEALCGVGATTVAVSRSVAAEVHRFYRQRVRAVITNCVDTGLFHPGDRMAARRRLGLDSDARYALFVGRFERRKGSDLVLDACRRAGFELLVAGPEAPAAARGLGSLEPARLAEAYRAADCVVFPSRYEGFGYVSFEALASGTPLVTTDTGAMTDFLELCPEYRRLIVTPEPDSLVRGLAAVDSVQGGDLLRQARQIVESSFGMSRFSHQWLELAASVAQQGPNRASRG